jgi:hypothetical protein
VRGVERLDDDRPAELRRDVDGVFLVLGHETLRHRHAVVAEESLRQVLVAGDLDTEVPRRRRDRGLDPLLVRAGPELHERLVVQAEVRDAARDRHVHDRLRGRPQRRLLAQTLQRVEPLLEVDRREVVFGARLHEIEGELAGADRDALLLHLVDEVVDAALLRGARAAERHGDADPVLELDRHVLGDVADPRPLLHAREEAALTPLGALVLLEARQHAHQTVVEAVQLRRRLLLEAADVDPHPDARPVRPEVRAGKDEGFLDPDALARQVAPLLDEWRRV